MKRGLAIVAVAVGFLSADSVRATCVGDCNADTRVQVSELVRGVAIALKHLNVATCSSLDQNQDGVVQISDLVVAVGHALEGCPVDTPTAVPSTATSTPTSSVIPTPTSTRAPGFAISGCVAEFPTSPCGQLAVVILEPLGLVAETGLGARYQFEDVPPGSYVLRVAAVCNPFGCWPPVSVEVVDQDLVVDIPIIERTPTPAATQSVGASRSYWKRGASQ